jgi:hypothetical protein
LDNTSLHVAHGNYTNAPVTSNLNLDFVPQKLEVVTGKVYASVKFLEKDQIVKFDLS